MTCFATGSAESFSFCSSEGGFYLMHGYEIHESITYPWPDILRFKHFLFRRLAHYEQFRG